MRRRIRAGELPAWTASHGLYLIELEAAERFAAAASSRARLEGVRS